MGNCCGSGTLPHKRIRRQESRAQRESRIIKHKQLDFVQTLLEKNKVKSGPASGAPGTVTHTKRQKEFTQSVILDDAKLRADKVDITEYSYPFENLVFEGGGVKALAYCGAVRVLEKLGLSSQIKRFAGSSSGAMTATLLAVGYNSHNIEDFLSRDLSKIFLDHSCGYFSVLPNLLRGYGWNPGKRIYRWFGNVLSEKTRNADITFSEVFEKYGNELCIIVTNLNMMNAEYFHRKTTPDVPVRDALRMSMGIPGLFQATQYELNGQMNTYIDGGVLCNYPIHCYDGWWLSMAMEDSFITKLEKLEDFPTLFEKKERFGKYNDKTLGFLLYSDNEIDVFQNKLERRVGPLPPYPETSLASEARGKKENQEKVKQCHDGNLNAVSAFLKVLKKHNINEDDKIDKAELENALKDEEDFPQRYRERLFGKDVTVEEAMLALDKNNDKKIQYNELVQFVERTGVCLQTQFLGYNRQEIKGLFSFFNTLQSALLTNMKRIFVEVRQIFDCLMLGKSYGSFSKGLKKEFETAVVKEPSVFEPLKFYCNPLAKARGLLSPRTSEETMERDIDRTVGINTGYVGTADFKLEPEDRNYVVNQGQCSTEAFLRNYVIKNNPPLKSTTVPKKEIKKTVIVVGNANKKDSSNVNQDMLNGRATDAVAFSNKIDPEPIVEPTADAIGCVANKIKTTTFNLKPMIESHNVN